MKSFLLDGSCDVVCVQSRSGFLGRQHLDDEEYHAKLRYDQNRCSSFGRWDGNCIVVSLLTTSTLPTLACLMTKAPRSPLELTGNFGISSGDDGIPYSDKTSSSCSYIRLHTKPRTERGCCRHLEMQIDPNH